MLFSKRLYMSVDQCKHAEVFVMQNWAWFHRCQVRVYFVTSVPLHQLFSSDVSHLCKNRAYLHSTDLSLD